MKSVKLNEIANVIMGQSPPGDSYNDKQIGLPLLNGAADYKGQTFSPQKYSSKPSKIVHRGDLLMGVRATIGNFAISDGEYCIGRGIAAIRVDEKLANKKYVLKVIEKKLNNLINISAGSTIKGIKKEDLTELVFPLPSLQKQYEIVGILDNAEMLRYKRIQTIDLLDEYLKSVFLDMFGDLIKNEKGWKIGVLDDLCGEIIDCPHSTPVYSDVPTDYFCLRSSDLQNGFLDLSTTKYVTKNEYDKRIKRAKLQKGDLVYCREGARFGTYAYLSGEINACLGQRTMLLRAKRNVVTPEFLWGVMGTKGITYQASLLVKQSASPHINVQDIKKYKAYIPPFYEQQNFSEIFHEVINLKQMMLKQLNNLENQFQALLQKAFN